ncbi:hypothetical protein [Leeuwenhoekiella sp. NPDC079379]|uniref:hypothetical protein n=1 Tax=Leeuwenhoekiella sp. NPDC079379 TaxID=3364122 RepID=UPI0037CCAFCA
MSRLTTQLLAIIKTDTVSDRGERNLISGNLGLLSGFDFNVNSPLQTTLYAPFTVSYDRASGAVGMVLEAYNPQVQIAAPGGTTHYKLSCGVSELDFAGATYVSHTQTTEILPYNNTPATAPNLNVQITANSSLSVVQVLSIEFYQEVNAKMYALQNGGFNAMAVVQVSQPT